MKSVINIGGRNCDNILKEIYNQAMVGDNAIRRTIFMDTGHELIYILQKKAVQYAIFYLEGEIEYIKSYVNPDADLDDYNKALLQTARGYEQDLKDLRKWDNLDEILKGQNKCLRLKDIVSFVVRS